MTASQSEKIFSRSDIVGALENIKTGQWVLYHCSRPLSQLTLSDYDAGVVRKKAWSLADSGQAMLFQQKKNGEYYYFARGVDPRIKKTIEKCMLLVPLPSRWA